MHDAYGEVTRRVQWGPVRMRRALYGSTTNTSNVSGTIAGRARGCPATNYLKDAVQTAAWSLPDIHYVEVTLTYEPPWSPEMMSDDAKAHFGIES